MWKIEFYTTSSGKSPITEFLRRLPRIPLARTRNVLRLLQESGPNLRQPYSKKLTGYKHLFELRTGGKMPVRLIYTINRRVYFILHAFVKKSPQTPVREIKTALGRIPS